MDRRRKAGLTGRPVTWLRVTVAASSAALLGTLGLAGTSHAASAAPAASTAKAAALTDHSSCHLGHGVKHVVQLTFDNVHFFRDNPNVPSDLEMMPNLLNFFENNGTFLSNSHTPLIAHTADDILTTNTGLYGDRQGMPVSNSYGAYNTDGTNGTFNTATIAGSFAYWTDPVFYSHGVPAGGDTNPNMVYAPVPPATAAHPVTPNTITPAPWVPFTRAGCNVGDVSTANQELENTNVDIPKVFGANSPEVAQLNADTDSFKDAETADYVGVAVHCASGNTFCAAAQAVKFGQTSPSATASPDTLPSEPGGYNGFQALFGHRYVAPQLGAGTVSLSRNGFAVTNAAGNLVDENGNQINGAFLSNHPGFPGFGGINASQTLAYLADMLESGVPVVNGYMADVHGNEDIPALSAACKSAPAALGSGSACYIAQAQYYNQAFGTFFQRLAADGITPANTLFVLSSDEGDHEAGANVGRAIQPSPANCDGATVSGDTVTPDVLCTYPSGSFGELAGNMTGLLATQKANTTPFTLEADTAPEFYVTGDPGPDVPAVRTLEHDVAGLTATNPYTGGTQNIANYLADPAEEAILHMVNADPARTPTLALFAKPDYFLSSGSHVLRHRVRDAEHRFRLGPRRLRGRDQHQLHRPRRSRGQAPGPGRLGRGRRPELGRPEQRPDRRRQQRHHRHLGRRNRRPPDLDVPDRAQGRLRARRPGHHPDPGQPEQRAQRVRRCCFGGLLQAAQLQRRAVRQLHPAGRHQGDREQLAGRLPVPRHRQGARCAGQGP